MQVKTKNLVTPSYFGKTRQELFGCYHEPQGNTVRSCGFVLCCPMGRDYIFSHRTFRQLAIRLSLAGFPVLRFDYYGCGDSAGEGEDGTVERWLTDIDTAIEELQARSGITKVSLAGFRLGATLATLTGTHHNNIESLILWDPVIDGAEYVEDLIKSHTRWLRLQVLRSNAPSKTGRTHEILGFPLTSALEENIKKIDLSSITAPPAPRILFMTSTEKSDPDTFIKHLENLDSAVDHQSIPWPDFWIDTEQLQDVLMPPVRILQALVAWATEVLS